VDCPNTTAAETTEPSVYEERHPNKNNKKKINNKSKMSSDTESVSDPKTQIIMLSVYHGI